MQLKITGSLKGLKYRAMYVAAIVAFITAGHFPHAFGQKRELDSLKKLLINHPNQDTNRVNLLNKLSYRSYTTKLTDLEMYGKEALALAKKINFTKGQATAYKNLGLAYLADNANPVALDYFDKALKVFMALHDNDNSARVLNNIGYYYGVIKDRSQELSYLLQSYEEIRNVDDPIVKATILGNIGNAYETIGQYQKARGYYEEELKLAIEKSLDGEFTTSNTNLASINLKEKKYQPALDYTNKVLAIQNKSDNFSPRDLANIYIIQGQTYYQTKEYVKARQVFTLSQEIAKNLGKAEYLSQNYYNLYLLDSVKGDFKSALRNYAQYTRLDDSLTSVNKNQVVAFYQIKFDSQKRIAENQKLKLNEERSAGIISQQHTSEIVLIIGLIIILGGVIYLYSINNQVKAKSEIINQQNHVLENNNMVKDKLFSVISHDLRSPITQVIGLLNLWEEGEMNHEEMSELTPTVKNSIVNTLELLDNLLIWSKNQMQGFNFNPLKFDLRDLAEENTYSLNRLIQKKAIVVINGIQPGTEVFADMEMIKIVLRNLLSNAIKFTPNKGIIHIDSSVKDGYIIICVEDNGIGIKEKDQKKIFSFTSHTTLGTAKEKGTGIGLKICRDFIELNNGRIWMESQENVGSKFYVSIPLNGVNVERRLSIVV